MDVRPSTAPGGADPVTPDVAVGHGDRPGPAAAPWIAGPPPPRRGARPPGPARFAPLAVWAMLGAAVAYVLSNDPADRSPDLLGGCGWYTMFGTNGPTCGGTRMVWYLLHGDLVDAARMHLVALIGTPFALYALVQWTANWMFGARLPVLRLRWWAYAGYGVVFVLYGAVLRNSPGFAWFHLDYMQSGVGL